MGTRTAAQHPAPPWEASLISQVTLHSSWLLTARGKASLCILFIRSMLDTWPKLGGDYAIAVLPEGWAQMAGTESAELWWE